MMPQPIKTRAINTLGDYLAAVGDTGGFLDVATAAAFAEVSRTRIRQLFEAGTLRRYSVSGRYAVSAEQFVRWATGVRRAGCRSAQAALRGVGDGTAPKTALTARQGPGTGFPAPGVGAGQGPGFNGSKSRPVAVMPSARKGASKCEK